MKLLNLSLLVRLNFCNIFLIMIYSAYFSNLKITTRTSTSSTTKPNALRKYSILLIDCYMEFEPIYNRVYNGYIMQSNKSVTKTATTIIIIICPHRCRALGSITVSAMDKSKRNMLSKVKGISGEIILSYWKSLN